MEFFLLFFIHGSKKIRTLAVEFPSLPADGLFCYPYDGKWNQNKNNIKTHVYNTLLIQNIIF